MFNSQSESHLSVDGRFPQYAWIALTNRCNLRCCHCALCLPDNQNLDEAELGGQAFSRFRDQILPNIDKLKIGGNNLGEQLMLKSWDEFLNLVASSGVKITLQTNGLLLSEKRIVAMVAAGVEFNISIEGATKESYEKIRRHGFRRLLAVLGNIKRIRRSQPNSQTTVLFSTTIFIDNIFELEPLIELAANMGVDGVIATHLVPVHESQRYQSLVYNRQMSNEMIERARERANKLGVQFFAPHPFGLGAMALGEQGQKNGARPICRHPWSSISIQETGNITPCCESNIIMGNLERQSFHDIWQGKKYQILREKVNGPRPPANCSSCVLRDPWSVDESSLLAVIGPNRQFDMKTAVFRAAAAGLKRSSLGARIFPALKTFYRSRM